MVEGYNIFSHYSQYLCASCPAIRPLMPPLLFYNLYGMAAMADQPTVVISDLKNMADYQE